MATRVWPKAPTHYALNILYLASVLKIPALILGLLTVPFPRYHRGEKTVNKNLYRLSGGAGVDEPEALELGGQLKKQ